MRRFTGKITNKVDKKGRVSVPAQFRATIREELEKKAGPGEEILMKISIRPAKGFKAIEAVSEELLDEIDGRTSELDIDSEDECALLYTIYPDIADIEIDRDGRVLIPRQMLDAVDISDTAVFVGLKNRFHIWEPNALEEHLRLQAARAKGLTLPKAGRSGAAR